MKRSLMAAALVVATILAVGNAWPDWARFLIGLGWFAAVVVVFDYLARQDRELADLRQLEESGAGRAALARCVHCGGIVDQDGPR